MPQQQKLKAKEIERDDQQPRKYFDEGELLALGKNMLAHGQLVPLIVYCNELLASDKGARKILLDGERRWRAGQLVGIEEFDAIVLDKRLTATKLRVLQLSLEMHRAGLSLMEKSNFLQRMREENNWQISDLVQQTVITQPMVSKLLALQKVCPDIQQLLAAGKLDLEKAYVISQEPDHAKQRELAGQASELSREQFRRQMRGISNVAEQKTDAARFIVSAGMCVTLQGKAITLSIAIDVLQETITQLRKGRKQGLDITTQQRVMRDKAKAHGGGAAFCASVQIGQTRKAG